jgi:hypothetical protein
LSKDKIPNFSESDAFSRISYTNIDKVTLEKILNRVRVLKREGLVNNVELQQLALNPDVRSWLGNVVAKSQDIYLRHMAYFLKCVQMNPTELLDLKLSQNPNLRFYPAEKLLEAWRDLAKEKKVTRSMISIVITTVKSYFSNSRTPLVKVKFVYKPKIKEAPPPNHLFKFREGFTYSGKPYFDFFLSVPVRDGQFQICPSCGEDFFPKWQNILTFPKIEPYSPFVIKPEKGHESENYRDDLRQVCFLTHTLALELNMMRDIEEKALGRPLRGEEYIFTHQYDRCSVGPWKIPGVKFVTPVVRHTIYQYFRTAGKHSGCYMKPQDVRAYTSSILGSCGINQRLCELYLGHDIGYKLSYVMNMVPTWQETFKKAKALETLDFAAFRQKQEKELTCEEIADVRYLLDMFRKGRLRFE